MLELTVPASVTPLALGSRPLVVVADDNPAVLRVVALVLERMGLEVVAAASGPFARVLASLAAAARQQAQVLADLEVR